MPFIKKQQWYATLAFTQRSTEQVSIAGCYRLVKTAAVSVSVKEKIRDHYYICVCLWHNAGRLTVMQPKPLRAVGAIMLHLSSKNSETKLWITSRLLYSMLLILDIYDSTTFIRKKPKMWQKILNQFALNSGKEIWLVMFAWQQVALTISERNPSTNPKA